MESLSHHKHIKQKTCRRYNIIGDAHALTFSCYKRQPFLARDRARTWLVESLDTARKKHTFDLWAYVLMPEHVHLLIFPTTDDYSISAILTDIKLPVTRKALKYIRTHRSPCASCETNSQTVRLLIASGNEGVGTIAILYSPKQFTRPSITFMRTPYNEYLSTQRMIGIGQVHGISRVEQTCHSCRMSTAYPCLGLWPAKQVCNPQAIVWYTFAYVWHVFAHVWHVFAHVWHA